MENKGVYLEVIPNEKLVFTDAYSAGWKPAPDPFMTAIVTFEDLGGGRTRYTAIARHRTPIPRRRTRTWASSTAGAPSPPSLRPMPSRWCGHDRAASPR